jgi:hypothetical protein
MEQALPDDLLYLLGKTVTKGDLCRLVRLNRHFYDLLIPDLYRSIEVDQYAVLPVAKTLVGNEQLSLHVRTLSLAVLPGWWDADRPQSIRPRLSIRPAIDKAGNAVLIPRAVEVMRKVTRSAHEESRWKEDLMGDHQDAWAAILLLLLGDLRKLQLKISDPYRYIGIVISRATALHFPRLEVVRTLERQMGAFTKAHWVAPFFAFPAMREFASSGLADIRGKRPLRFGTVSSSITHLTLERSMLTANALRVLLSSCPNLQCLKYDHRAMANEPFHMGILHDCLAPRKDTLRSLWLNYRYFGDAPLDRQEPCLQLGQWMGSFSSYGRLRELRIPLELLLDIGSVGHHPRKALFDKVLPSALEWLYIHDCYEARLPMLVLQLLWLVLHRERQAPCLTRLDLQNKRTYTWWLPFTTWFHHELLPLSPESSRMPRSLQGVCDAKGIEFYVQDRRHTSVTGLRANNTPGTCGH